MMLSSNDIFGSLLKQELYIFCSEHHFTNEKHAIPDVPLVGTGEADVRNSVF